MKRVLSLVLALVMLLSLAACSGAARRARVQIVTTSFPIYDWTRNIVGDVDGVVQKYIIDEQSSACFAYLGAESCKDNC